MTNITQMLDRAAEEYGDRIAYSDPYNRITYSELKDRAGRIATYLADVKGRDVIRPETALCFYPATSEMLSSFPQWHICIVPLLLYKHYSC